MRHNYMLFCLQPQLYIQLVTRLLELQLTDWSLYFVFLYFNTFSLTNVLEMESCCSHLLEKSTAIVIICAFSYMSFPYVYCWWFSCSIYLLVYSFVYIADRLCYLSLSYSYWYYCWLIINSSMHIIVSVTFALFFSCERYWVIPRNNIYATHWFRWCNIISRFVWKKHKRFECKTLPIFFFLKFVKIFPTVSF